jgi:hypothetical protein
MTSLKNSNYFQSTLDAIQFETLNDEFDYWPENVTIVGSKSKVLPCCNKKIIINAGTKISKKRCASCNRSFYPIVTASQYLSEKLHNQAVSVNWIEVTKHRLESIVPTYNQLTFDLN